jgi:hypothetical protein
MSTRLKVFTFRVVLIVALKPDGAAGCEAGRSEFHDVKIWDSLEVTCVLGGYTVVEVQRRSADQQIVKGKSDALPFLSFDSAG